MSSVEVSTGISVFSEILQCVNPAVQQLFVRSNNLDDLLARPRVAIVGSRKITAYGKKVTTDFARELAEQGIVIVSGLAYGVDVAAHRAALQAGGLTIAVLPGSVEEIYPAAHRNMALEIVKQGGALLSEYPVGTPTYPTNFVERNRIVSGLSDAVLITEAAEKSGTMHTARFALEQGKDVLAVPGNITSPTSAGTNNLLKTGAIAATSAADVLSVLGLKAKRRKKVAGGTPDEQCILDLIGDGIMEGNELLERSGLGADKFSTALIMLEITGKIRPVGANQWTAA